LGGNTLERNYQKPYRLAETYWELPSQLFALEYSGKNFNARIHTDLLNKRLVVKDYTGDDWEEASRNLKYIAQKYDLGKILFNIRAGDKRGLEKYGFVVEGRFPGYFQDQDAICYSCFTDPLRGESKYLKQEEQLLNTVLQLKQKLPGELASDYVLRAVREDEAEKLVEIYKENFTTYPSPLTEIEYIKKVMGLHVRFLGIFLKDRLLSAASAEINNGNAEITDCATLKEFRGKGFLTHLLKALEEEMETSNVNVLFSLGRAGSFGMNVVLHHMSYNYCGRFINNCHIDGRFEDMNLWVKELSPSLN